MPSSKGYKRDYKQEAKTAKARGEQGTGSDSGSAVRHRARREAIKAGILSRASKLDVDHKKPLSKGGAGEDLKNLRAVPASENRSFPRTSSGAVKKP